MGTSNNTAITYLELWANPGILTILRCDKPVDECNDCKFRDILYQEAQKILKEYEGRFTEENKLDIVRLHWLRSLEIHTDWALAIVNKRLEENNGQEAGQATEPR